MLRGRQRGQAIGLAAVAMVAMVALLAYVIDAGMFFMIRRELQNTADTAALAGAAYLYPPGPALPVIPPGCVELATVMWGLTNPQQINSAEVACAYARRNAPAARSLCVNYVQMDRPSFGTWPGHPSLAMTVAVHCEAMYSFGRILTLQSKTIGAHATGAIGLHDRGVLNGEVRTYVIGYDPLLLVPATRLVAD
jgi:hypothetical protein